MISTRIKRTGQSSRRVVGCAARREVAGSEADAAAALARLQLQMEESEVRHSTAWQRMRRKAQDSKTAAAAASEALHRARAAYRKQLAAR